MKIERKETLYLLSKFRRKKKLFQKRKRKREKAMEFFQELKNAHTKMELFENERNNNIWARRNVTEKHFFFFSIDG